MSHDHNTFDEIMKRKHVAGPEAHAVGIVMCQVIGQATYGKKEFLQVDAGIKSEGVVCISEFDKDKLPKKGDYIELTIVDSRSFPILMSFKIAKQIKQLEELRKLMRNKSVTNVTFIDRNNYRHNDLYRVAHGDVTGWIYTKKKYNHGESIAVTITKVHGTTHGNFNCMPVKQSTSIKVGQKLELPITSIKDNLFFFELDNKMEAIATTNKIDFVGNVGDKHHMEVVSIEGNKVILSFLEESQENDVLLEQRIYTATIKEIKDNGLILEWLPNITGFCHARNIFWTPDFARDPRVSLESFKIGDSIDVRISRNINTGNVALNIKSTNPNPYAKFNEQYNRGDIVEVTITAKFDQDNNKEIFCTIPGSDCSAIIRSNEIETEKFEAIAINDSLSVTIRNIDVQKSLITLSTRSNYRGEASPQLDKLVLNNTYKCTVLGSIEANTKRNFSVIKVSIDEFPSIKGFIKESDFQDTSPEAGEKINAIYIKPAGHIAILRPETANFNRNTKKKTSGTGGRFSNKKLDQLIDDIDIDDLFKQLKNN